MKSICLMCVMALGLSGCARIQQIRDVRSAYAELQAAAAEVCGEENPKLSCLERFGVSEEQIEKIRKALAKGPTPAEMELIMAAIDELISRAKAAKESK